MLTKLLELKIDNPGGTWLAERRTDNASAGANAFGAPRRVGPITANFNRHVMVPVAILKGIPGSRGEQGRVSEESLQWLTSYMSEHGEFPKVRTGADETDNPFIEVDMGGHARVNEGNHRIMASDRLGWEYIPIDIRYYSGGEAEDGPLSPNRVIEYDRAAIAKGHTPTNYGGRVMAPENTVPFSKPLDALMTVAAGRGWAPEVVASKKAALLAAMNRHPSRLEGKAEGVLGLYGHGPELLRARQHPDSEHYTVETYSIMHDGWLVQKEYPLSDLGKKQALDDAFEWYPMPAQQSIPANVLRRVQDAVERLSEIGARVTEARQLDERFGGAGRYVNNVLENRAKDIEAARRVLKQFRELAPKNGIDAESVITSLGGETALPDEPTGGPAFPKEITASRQGAGTTPLKDLDDCPEPG
jgi:hypothetical protein